MEFLSTKEMTLGRPDLFFMTSNWLPVILFSKCPQLRILLEPKLQCGSVYPGNLFHQNLAAHKSSSNLPGALSLTNTSKDPTHRRAAPRRRSKAQHAPRASGTHHTPHAASASPRPHALSACHVFTQRAPRRGRGATGAGPQAQRASQLAIRAAFQTGAYKRRVDAIRPPDWAAALARVGGRCEVRPARGVSCWAGSDRAQGRREAFWLPELPAGPW